MCPFVNKYVPRLTHWTLCWIKWQTLLCIPSWEANGCKLYYSAAETHFPINLLYKVQCFSLRHILTLQQIVHRRFLSLPSIHGVKKQISFRSFSHCEVTVELEKKKSGRETSFYKRESVSLTSSQSCPVVCLVMCLRVMQTHCIHLCYTIAS